MGILDRVAFWRGNQPAARNGIYAVEIDGPQINTALHRAGILNTFQANVLGADGIMPVFRPPTADMLPDPSILIPPAPPLPERQLQAIRTAQQSWRNIVCNPRGDSPWTLQAQALTSLVDYGHYFLWLPTIVDEFGALVYSGDMYILDPGARKDPDKQKELDEATRLDPRTKINPFWYFNGVPYPRSEIVLVEIPSKINQLVNAVGMGELLAEVYELQGRAFESYTGLLSLMATVFAPGDMTNTEQPPPQGQTSKPAQKLSGMRIVELPSNTDTPSPMDVKTDAAGLKELDRMTTEYKSAATGLSNLALSKDYTGVNYTSGLLALQSDQRIYHIYEQRLHTLCWYIQLFWFDIYSKMLSTGEWTSYSYAPLDPVKASRANIDLVAAGLMPQSEAFRRTDQDAVISALLLELDALRNPPAEEGTDDA